MEEGCKICGLKIIFSDTNSYVVLTEKVVNGIKNAKKRRGDSSSVIRQNGKSQNECFKKTKHAKFSKKRIFLPPDTDTYIASQAKVAII